MGAAEAIFLSVPNRAPCRFVECREQAKRMQRLEDRDALERVARIWEKTADVREHHPELEAGGQKRPIHLRSTSGNLAIFAPVFLRAH